MSGKYANKKKSSGKGLWIILALALVLCACLLLLAFLTKNNRENMPLPTEPSETESSIVSTDPSEAESATAATDPSYTFEQNVEGVTSFALEEGLEINRYGKYIGVYMEDGSDEIVTNVMMIEVKNTGNKTIQYAQIILSGPAGDAVFNLTTLMPGDTMVVLEANRKAYSDTDVYTEAQANNVAYFAEPVSLQEDVIQISGLDGMLNVQNISDSDITGDIAIYYKYTAQDIYYGGITFRVKIEGGLKAGELRQILAGHYTSDGCAIVQVTIHE